MTTPPSGRDTFPLGFKDARNREALKRMAELTGQPMTVIAERAIEHEITLLAANLEQRLADALKVVRGYLADRDLDTHLDAAVASEDSDLGPGLKTVATHNAGQPLSARRAQRPVTCWPPFSRR